MTTITQYAGDTGYQLDNLRRTKEYLLEIANKVSSISDWPADELTERIKELITDLVNEPTCPLSWDNAVVLRAVPNTTNKEYIGISHQD